MKKLILTLLLGGLIMTGAFANPSTGSGNVAFVYFSATGTTERMAKNAAKEMGADIFEIQLVHKYTDADLNWHDKKSLTTIECNDPKCRPAIESVV
ncbi:MAG: flavodoxin [Treponema sp.]|uniref:flavodoxin n=1 Tax=Treponema sp. TaxID=166 RepID=UPI002A90A745|nr:flavodoxin [Treponema sp.]MDY6396118.1 flavodoxin [Treponema sp.]